jgi:hypothetical protein
VTNLSTNPSTALWEATPPATSYSEVAEASLEDSAWRDDAREPLIPLPPSATGAKSSRWEAYVSRRIAELARREYDFTGLTPPSQSTLQEAWSVANQYFRFDTATPSVVPSESGSVVFVWHKAGWDVEIDVAQGERFVWAYESSTGKGFSGPLQEHSESLSKLLVLLSAL